MNKKTVTISAVLFVFSFMLSACSYTEPNTVISNILPDNKAEYSTDTSNEFELFYNEYKRCNTEYFKNARDAMQSIVGSRYSYGITAYDHGDDLAELSELFFDPSGENSLDIYFALRGFDDREYTADGRSAGFTCKKGDDAYVYELSYDPEQGRLYVDLSVNGNTKQRLDCRFNSDELSKLYFDADLNRTFISVVKNSGEAEVKWIDDKIDDLDSKSDAAVCGYVTYNGELLEGLIK